MGGEVTPGSGVVEGATFKEQHIRMDGGGWMFNQWCCHVSIAVRQAGEERAIIPQ